MTKKAKRKNTEKVDSETLLGTAKFKLGDLVGARVKGYPIWPGHIEKIDIVNNKLRYTVRFFYSDDTSHQHVELKHFKDFTEKELNCKRAGFREALEICQNEYENSKHDTPNEILNNDGSHNDDDHVEPNGQKLPTNDDTVSNDKSDDDKMIIDDSNKDKTNNRKPVKRQSLVSKKTKLITIEKLKNKMDKKINEKELLKRKKMESKLAKKLIDKLQIINEKLEVFDRFKEYLMKACLIKPISPNDCNSAVRMLFKILTALNRCIELIKNKKVSDSSEPRLLSSLCDCEERITNIVCDLKMLEKNEKLPNDLKKVVHECRRGFKQLPHIKELVNEGHKSITDVMIERKENNVKLK